MRTSTLFTARNIAAGININNTWYPVLEKLLEWCLKLKYKTDCSFKQELQKLKQQTIIYADKHPLLGSGLNYKLTSLTKTKHFPGQNKLGEYMEQLISMNSDNSSDN